MWLCLIPVSNTCYIILALEQSAISYTNLLNCHLEILSEYEDTDFADLSEAVFESGYTTFITDRESVTMNEDGSIDFSATNVWSWFYYGNYKIIEKTYEWVQTGEDSATGQGTRINAKGCWFMYNTIDVAGMEVDKPVVINIQAGNNKDNIVGQYCVIKKADNTYVVDYVIADLDDTHKIQFDGCHFWVNEDGSKFINSPGNQKGNATAVTPGEEFTFEGSKLNVFAHFNVSYWELQEVEIVAE